MIRACLTVAQSDDYRPVWTNQPPADFETDVAQLATDFGAVVPKAAQTDRATGGAADAKAQAETALEDAAFVLARGLATHFKRSESRSPGKVDFTKSALMKLRAQDLINQATAIRDIGAAAVKEPHADRRFITAERVAGLTDAIATFSELASVPRGQFVNRGALLREVETDVAALADHLGDMDDLVVQFTSEGGTRFADAWKHARIIVDSGGGHSRVPPPPAPTSPQQEA